MENVYLIAAGGTGGHFYPGFALGMKLKERGHDVVFVIKKNSPSIELLKENEINYHEMDFSGMPRGKNPFKWIVFVWKLLASLFKMRGLIKSYKPAVCIGMGGYISFPLIYAAHHAGVKTVVHDSNSKIGLANRICDRYVDLFLLGMPTTDKLKRALLVGTPVREEFRLKESVEEKNYWDFATDFGITILIFGGSQGAKFLNRAAAQTVLSLFKKTQRLHIVHITGTRDYEDIKALYNGNPNVEIVPYAEEIHALMKAAHFVISRSGAGTLAELIALKKPAILVPYPYASDNHQYYNAKMLSDKGCAVLINETQTLHADIEAVIKKILASPEAIKNMSANFKGAGLPDSLNAADNAADIIEKLVCGQLKN